ncbi:glycosyltransferase family 2 protein [Granulicella sp. S190]|uniref:glycosyltransferase family 2 protein n=1 Tax=Granulicella sp. S190 TaxID=1747226 RepID=UPI00131DB4AC|nr:glycosyltransferase family 2 protein [Granulicella sp. S190]
MPRSTLSIAIITLNEEANLARTLASAKFADELIVVDSGSNDRTVEIAHSFGAKVFTEPWRGFAGQKNFAIEKCTGTWILSLDADEELSIELQNEMKEMLKTHTETSPQIEGYRLRRRNIFLGRWMRHGGYYPDLKLRLVRNLNGAGAPRFTERLVHESMQIAGRVETLKQDYLHYGYPDLNTYLEHMNQYSMLGGRIAAAKGKNSRSWPAFCWDIVLAPIFTFLWNYLFRLGFLDGREGLLLHLYHSAYVSWKYAKAWQIGRSERS